MRPKVKKRLSLWLIGFLLICAAIGAIWFCFLGGGYELELWQARFDSDKWIQNTRTDRIYSCRRPMVKSLMRQLKPGMSREEVEKLIGKPDYARDGWPAYNIGFPRWDPFYLDNDVFEVLYEHDHLVRTRVRNT
jgi:hypothetical protein